MAACKSLVGVTTIETSPLGVDGALGTTMTALGLLVPDSVVLTFAAQTKTDIMIENQVDPYLTVLDPSRIRELKFSSRDIDPVTLQTFFGGTGNTTVWSASRSAEVAVERSIRITSRVAGGNSWVITIPRAAVQVDLDGKMQSKDTMNVNFVCTILSPLDTAATASPVVFTRS